MLKRHEINMIDGPILSRTLLFAYPIILSNVLNLLFNTADIVVVGQFAGSNSLAAVGSTTSLINLIIGLFTGFSIGASVVTARAYGERSQEKITQSVHCSMALGIVLGAVVGILGFFASEPLLKLTKTDPAVLPLAAVYLKYYFLGTPALLIQSYSAAILRAVGDSNRPMYFLTLAGIVNVVLNLIFVIVFHMDVVGVALATAISRYLSAVLSVLALMHSKDRPYQLKLKNLRFHKDILRQLIVIGLPSGLTGSINNISNVTIQSTVNSFGAITMAGASAASSITPYIYNVQNGFTQACMNFVSQNIGAKQHQRIRKILAVNLIATIAVSAGLCAACYFFCDPLLSIFVSKADPQYDAIIKEGAIRLFLTGTFAWLFGLQEVTIGALRGFGRSWLPTIISLIGTCAFRIFWTVCLFPMNPTIEMLYIGFPVSWVITASAELIALLFVCQRDIKPKLAAK